MKKDTLLIKALLRSDSRYFYSRNNELTEIRSSDEIKKWKDTLAVLINDGFDVNDENNSILGISFKSRYLGDNFGLSLNEEEINKIK